MAQPMSVFDRIQAQQQKATATTAQSEQSYQNALGQFTQYHQEYADGRRNPVADMIRKPERDQAAEKRHKQAASIGLIGDALGLIGKSYAASKGVKPSPTEGTTTYRALGELQRLDDIYRQDGVRYDHNMLLDSLRRKGAEDQVQQVQLREAGNQRAVAEARLQEANQRMEGYQNAQTKAVQDKTKDELEWQRTKERDALRYRRDVSLRNISAGGKNSDEFKISAGNVALVFKNPKTGGMEPVADGDYNFILNDAVAKDPSLKSELSGAMTKMEYDRIAHRIVGKQLQKKGIEVSAVQSPKSAANISSAPVAKVGTKQNTYDLITATAKPLLDAKNLTDSQREAALISVLSQFPEDVAQEWANNNVKD